MNSPTRICLVALIVITVLGQCTPAISEEPNREPQRRDDRFGEFPVRPGPGEPPLPSVFGTGEFQLLGFTERQVTGEAGVLNYSYMCGEKFPGSRMCTVREVMRTVNIPTPPGVGHAWVQVEETRAHIHAAALRPVRKEVEPMDCQGWTSKAATVYGMTISLDPSVCYGGLMAAACNDPGAVACCGVMEEEERIK